MKYITNFNVVLLGPQDPAVLKQEIEKDLRKEGSMNLQISKAFCLTP